VIVGDAFGLWELTDREGVSKLETQFVNSTVIVTLLILAVPLYFLMRDIRAAIVSYGIGRASAYTSRRTRSTSRRPGESSPRTRRSRFSCTGTPTFHPCARSTDGTSSGSWLKRLDYVPVRLGRLPGIYVPSYQLNYFELTEADGTIRIRYRIIPRPRRNDLTLLERLLILGRRVKKLPPIPPETRAGRAPEAS
jgi:hypothetical protein